MVRYKNGLLLLVVHEIGSVVASRGRGPHARWGRTEGVQNDGQIVSFVTVVVVAHQRCRFLKFSLTSNLGQQKIQLWWTSKAEISHFTVYTVDENELEMVSSTTNYLHIPQAPKKLLLSFMQI